MLLTVAGPALAQEAGAQLVQAGIVHIQTLDRSEPLHTQMKLLGSPSEFDSPGTAAAIDNADTVLLAWSYFFSEHWVLKLEGGIPPTFHMQGEGTVAPPVALGLLNVDLGAASNNPIASARQWSPALQVQYWLGRADARWRAYVGLGATYTWYTDVELNDAFAGQLDARFAKPLALLNGKPTAGTRESADASASLAPIVNAGLAYALTPHWGLSLSLSWIGLSTKATIDLRAADGSLLARSSTHIDVYPLVSALMLSYCY